MKSKSTSACFLSCFAFMACAFALAGERTEPGLVQAISDPVPTPGDWLLQVREVAFFRLYQSNAEWKDGRTISSAIEQDIRTVPRYSMTADMTIEKAPAGVWTGKLKTGETRGSADVISPQHKDARALVEIWQRHARTNGDIPGALVGELAAAVKTFIGYNPTWETVPKLNALLPRLDATRDWKAAEAIALLDEVAAIQDSPLNTAAEMARRGTIRKGDVLPKKFADAPWGAPLDGLRAAWVLEPRSAEHPIGAALKARLLVQNSGPVAVMLQVPTWYQGGVKATDAKGAEVQASGLEWTTLAELVPVRLAPGEYIEINTPGVGIGSGAGRGPWAGPRVGSIVLAKPGDELTLRHNLVPLDGSNVGVRDDAPHVSGPGWSLAHFNGPSWWLGHIKGHLNRELPLPADAAERTRLLDRAVRELFATAPTAEETAAFVADKTRDALDALAKRLAERTDVVSFIGALATAPVKFRVLAADANANKRPRVVLGPGEYPVGEATVNRGRATLKIVGRPVGDRRKNDTQLLFEPAEATGRAAPPPHKLEIPDGWGTWAIACRPSDGFFYLLHHGSVRKIDYRDPVKVTDTPSSDLPAEFRDEVKRQLDIQEISEAQQAEIFKTAVGTPKLPKLPDEAYTKTGVHCQKFRGEDAKRPGGELMGGVLEPSNPWDRDKEPLVLGVRTARDAQWRIGGTAKVGLVVRNRTGIIGRVHSGRDVKFSYTGRLDHGLSVVAVDEAGKEHEAAIAHSDGLLTFQRMLLPVAHVAAIKEFTIRFDAEKRDVSEPHVAAFHLPPGKYKLRCKWNDARPDAAHEGEWTGELVNEELAFTLAAAVAAPQASETPKATEQEPFTAWGKEVAGLQAGLGFKAGEKRAYTHGEWATLVVRVRNVGKEEAKFDYTPEHFIENPPTVLDEKAKAVSLAPGLVDTGVQIGREANLAPGKEIELAELTLEFSSRNEAGAGFLKPLTIYGTGKFQVGFEKVLGTGFIKPDPALSKLATGKLELTIQPVAPVPQEAPKPKPPAADAPKPDAAHGGLRADVKPDSRQLFNEDYAAFAVQSEKDVNFVLCYQGSLSNGIAEWSSGAKWRFNGNVYLVDRAKTAIAGKSVNKRVIAVNYTSDDPTKLFLDGKAYNLAAQPRMTSMGALEDAPGRVFLLRDEGEPFQTTRTLPLRNEKDLATIGMFAVGDCFSAGLYAENRRVQEMEGWVLAFDFQVPERRSGGHRIARLRIFPDGRVLSSPDGRALRELKISDGEVSELLRWLAEDQKVPAVKAQAAQPGDPKPTIDQEFDTWAGGVSFLQFKHNDQLHSMTVGSHPRKPGTGKELANPGAAAFESIGERLAELENKAATAPVKAGADAGKPADKSAETGQRADESRLQPKQEYAQELFRKWQANARTDGKIPGGLIGQLAESVKTFIEYHLNWETVPQLEKMLPRLDASHDWAGQDAVALLDELAAVRDSPINLALDREEQGLIRTGAPLPPELADAPWGGSLPNGLRHAWLLEPLAAEHRLGTALKARVLIHNSGEAPVVFRTRTWQQTGYKATGATGAEIKTASTLWKMRGLLLVYRLAPGEFIEVNGPGIGVGPVGNREDWQQARVDTWIQAKAGEEVTVATAPLPLYDWGEEEQLKLDGEPRWWLDHIKARFSRHLPFPAEKDARERLLYRVAMELFGTPYKDAAFVADTTPGALDALALRIFHRAGQNAWAGPLTSGSTKFRVLPADPDVRDSLRAALAVPDAPKQIEKPLPPAATPPPATPAQDEKPKGA